MDQTVSVPCGAGSQLGICLHHCHIFFYLSVFLVFSPFLCLPVPPSLPLSPPVSRPLSRRPIEANTRALEQELQCPLCKGLVKQPILLPCHHSVCLHCASQLLIQNGYPAPDMSPEPNSPASTPNSRSPRLARRPMPKSDRVERVLRTGLCLCYCVTISDLCVIYV